MATATDVLEVCREVVAYRLAHPDDSNCVINSVDFDPLQGGYCARFVRQSADAVLGGEFRWAYSGPTARSVEQALKDAGKRIDGPSPGCVVALNGISYWAGHIARCGEPGYIYENTSSGSRGNPVEPGTKRTPIVDVEGEITGFYADFAPGEVPQPTGYQTGPVKVQVPSGQVVDAWLDGSNAQVIVGVGALAAAVGWSVLDAVRSDRLVEVGRPSIGAIHQEGSYPSGVVISVEVMEGNCQVATVPGWFTDHAIVPLRPFAKALGYDLADQIVQSRLVVLKPLSGPVIGAGGQVAE